MQWLIPAEVVPTEVRGMCHGFAAAVGKAGALVAGVVFGLVNDPSKIAFQACDWGMVMPQPCHFVHQTLFQLTLFVIMTRSQVLHQCVLRSGGCCGESSIVVRCVHARAF